MEDNENSNSSSPQKKTKSIDDLDLSDESEQIDLDEDVYGAVIYSVIYDSFELMTGQDHDNLDWKVNLYRMFFCILLLVCNYTLQMGLVVTIYRYVAMPSVRKAQQQYQRYHAEVFLDGEFNQDAFDNWDGVDHLCNIAFGNYWFMFMILCLWWLLNVIEVRKTLMLYIRFRDLGNCQNPMEILERIEIPEKQNLILNLMPWMRWVLYTVILIPKMIIAAALLLVGTIWLASTDSFENVVLNSVALAFVIGIDELIFAGLVPFTMKKNINITKLVNIAVSKAESHLVEVTRGYRDSTLCLIVVVGGVMLYMSRWGQGIHGLGVFPGYLHDVSGRCSSWWEARRAEVCEAGEACFEIAH